MRDRRLGVRVPLDLMVSVFVNDRPLRGLVLDLSDSGIRLDVVAGRAPAHGTPVQLEIGLPGSDDTLWIAGTVQNRHDADLASGLGIRFVVMARSHARALRDFCIQRRHLQLGTLLARIRPGAMVPGSLAAARAL